MKANKERKQHYHLEILLLIVVYLFSVSPLYSQCGYIEVSFTELMGKVSKIVRGEITNVQHDNNEFIQYTFTSDLIENYQILIPNNTDYYYSGNPQLGQNKQYTLLLKASSINPNCWEIVSHGVFNFEDYNEVMTLSSVFKNSAKHNAKDFNNKKNSLNSLKLKKMLRRDIAHKITTNDNDVIENLITSLDEDDLLLAVKIIGRFEKKIYRNKIIEFIKNSPNRNILLSSLSVLGKIGEDEDVELVASFLNSSNQQERRIAIETIGMFKKIFADYLFEHYTNENNFGNRVAIIEVIEKISDNTIKSEILIPLLAVEDNEFVRKFIQNRIPK